MGQNENTSSKSLSATITVGGPAKGDLAAAAAASATAESRSGGRALDDQDRQTRINENLARFLADQNHHRQQLFLNRRQISHTHFHQPFHHRLLKPSVRPLVLDERGRGGQEGYVAAPTKDSSSESNNRVVLAATSAAASFQAKDAEPSQCIDDEVGGGHSWTGRLAIGQVEHRNREVVLLRQNYLNGKKCKHPDDVSSFNYDGDDPAHGSTTFTPRKNGFSDAVWDGNLPDTGSVPGTRNAKSAIVQAPRGRLRPTKALTNLHKSASLKYEREALLDKAIEFLDPDLKPIPPQPSSGPSMQIYHDHRKMASDYLNVMDKIEELKQKKKVLEEKLKASDEEFAKGATDDVKAKQEIEKFFQLKSEKESLVETRERLSSELNRMKANKPKVYPGVTAFIKTKNTEEETDRRHEAVEPIVSPNATSKPINMCPLGRPVGEEASAGSAPFDGDWVIVQSVCGGLSPNLVDEQSNAVKLGGECRSDIKASDGEKG